jgi:WD40 repeat protein
MKPPHFLFLLLLLFAFGTAAQPTQPILRLENGMHTADATRISTDAAGKYLLTSGNDKTARLWDVATGQLLNTLRVPIGGIIEGKVDACALSRDGTVAALGGHTGYEWDTKYCIYIVQTQTGNIIHRITGLPNGIFDLEFSPDGQWLAAGLWRTGGVHIFDTKNWQETKKLDGYNDNIENVAFDNSGRLATTCFDGKLRLYDKHFELITEQENLAGKQLMSVAFNPSGTLLAVGYYDTPVIEVRSGKDLSLLYHPAVPDAENINSRLEILSFSADGKSLYGGGAYEARDDKGNWRRVIRAWANEGKDTYTDFPLMQNIIVDIKTLPGGSVAVIGAYPEIALLSGTGKVLWYKDASKNDFAAKNKSHLRVNDAGDAIGFTPLKQPALTFVVTSRSLSQETASYPAPTDKNGGTEIDNWAQSNNPSINSRGVAFMQKLERTLSVDVSSNGKEILMGADFTLYKADSLARRLWRTSLPSEAWAVHISGNNKTAIAALGDGTIRWYNMANGKEFLAFYLNSDKKRWVLFTPSGYYDASPGAEDMLGWHINNGPDKAPSFYPVSRFRSQFYRPDIIDAVLQTRNEEEAIALANSHSTKQVVASTDIKEKLPPVITITGPLNGSTVGNESLKITYSLKTPENAPVKNIKVLVNGRPVAIERGVKVMPTNDYSVSITVPPNDCTVTLMAENDNGISPEANLYLKYKAPQKSGDEFVVKPKLYVLAIGISGYQNADLKLNYAADDATSFASALKQLKGGLYGDVIVKPLIDKDATKDNILDGLDWIQKQTSQKDVAMIFYAGHGINDNNGIFYMLPVGADVNRLRSTGLNFEELRQTVSNIAGKVLVFIDACHSGNAMGTTGRRGSTDINALVNELSSTQNGAITFTSSTGQEYSLEDASWKHGAFTMALLEGLAGKASIPGKNKITVKSLDAYVSERVKDLTGGRQHPTSVVPPNVPDFPIAAAE